MGPAPDSTVGSAGVRAQVPAGSIVYASGVGSNVVDVDGNRYVDLAAGFGALLLGHAHPSVLRVLELQAARLMLALGDVHPADAKIALVERLARLYPAPGARAIVLQSGSDAIGAALKTALLATGKPGVLAFEGAYHGLSHGPLAACGLRASYREPFAAQLNPHVSFVEYPADAAAMTRTLETVRAALRGGAVGAVLVEPILGRGGCVVPPAGLLPSLIEVAHEHGALVIADEVWTGLGRSGAMLYSAPASDAPGGAARAVPDLICLGKGLGGGLPVSACLGSAEVMGAWRREPEVVHTTTFAGAPLASATALATLDTLSRRGLVERSRRLGEWWRAELAQALTPLRVVRQVRGAGLMLAIDLGDHPQAAVSAARGLLEAGFIVSTGGGTRAVVVLTPPLTIAREQLAAFVAPARRVLSELPP